ncbi:hypothetical protein [Tepidibacter mesophilus]|uniref:hypothetical protein n=1 Tax=Tepidibacter mesophilus TaxID=655607 RepID=UPI000C07A3DD|nr:hypothetical protein [Tepidibacter mesophilus]
MSKKSSNNNNNNTFEIPNYNNVIDEKTKKKHIFLVIRIIGLLIGYLSIMFTYSDIQNLFLTAVVFMIPICCDYIIILLTNKKSMFQWRVSIAIFSIVLLVTILFGFGSLGVIDFVTDSSNIDMIRFLKTDKTVLFSFKCIPKEGSIFIIIFATICFYLLEYTGILARDLDFCIKPNETANIG